MAAPGSDDALGRALGLELGDPEVRAEGARIARRLMAAKARSIGLIPADPEVAVPAVAIQLGASLCDMTGATVAVVDANLRYPGLGVIANAPGATRRDDESVFATRWLHGSLALLTAPRVERAGDVVPALARLLLEGSSMFGHILCDLTGFDLIGEHGSAAACMDGVVLVGRAHQTRDDDLVELTRLIPKQRLLGVLLVG